MGNCVFRAEGNQPSSVKIKVVTCNGGVMELYPPLTAECITNGFPGHGLFHGMHDVILPRRPLLHNEELVGGELYHLRPLNTPLTVLPSLVAPYRVSFDHHGFWRRHDHMTTEIMPSNNYNSSAMWKVKLVISPAQLMEILSQESRTEALIESVRTVAKCGNGSAAASSVGSSDQCSLASSRKASSENVGSVVN